MILLYIWQWLARRKSKVPSELKSKPQRRLRNVHYLYASNAVWKGVRRPF